MSTLLNVVLPIFLVILVGYLAGKLTRLDILPVADIAMFIASPALIFSSLLKQKIVLLDAAKIWTSYFFITFGCMLVAYIVFKLMRERHRGLYLPISLMNTGNIPYPVMSLAYGTPGLAAAVLFSMPQSFVVYTYGVYVVVGKETKENLAEVFKQPVIYAAILGLIFNFAGWTLPILLMQPIDMLSGLAIPLILIVSGHNLSRVKFKSVKTTLLASFLRMGVGLGLGLIVVSVLGMTGIPRAVVLLVSAMPSAANSTILATRYDNEAELVASVVFTTTLASLAVIPIMLHFLV
jgi:malate permease and related proteins